jgi:hypothetical protein
LVGSERYNRFRGLKGKPTPIGLLITHKIEKYLHQLTAHSGRSFHPILRNI